VFVSLGWKTSWGDFFLNLKEALKSARKKEVFKEKGSFSSFEREPL
jgi:hypothetical protein